MDRLPTLPERKLLKGALRSVGFSSRLTDWIVHRIWQDLKGEAEAENVHLREQLEALASSVARDATRE
jgi:hypothetical protein